MYLDEILFRTAFYPEFFFVGYKRGAIVEILIYAVGAKKCLSAVVSLSIFCLVPLKIRKVSSF
jgi:hypothetical protein